MNDYTRAYYYSFSGLHAVPTAAAAADAADPQAPTNTHPGSGPPAAPPTADFPGPT